jgi:D-sedoheptulose 7-phosphate isomerase
MESVEQHFRASADTIQGCAQSLAPVIAIAATALLDCFDAKRKLMICGNGGSAADAQHFSSELLNRYDRERRELPGIALTTDASTLTAIGNDYEFAEVFAKQVRALAQPGDLLLVITTSGNSVNILRAVAAAHESGIRCIALNGKSGGKLNDHLSGDDVNILVPSDTTAHVQEVHGVVIHCLCALIDEAILGQTGDTHD